MNTGERTVYAVGDVHGRNDLLQTLVAGIRRDGGNSKPFVVMLGDYVDRGPDSKGVLDFATAPHEDIDFVWLKGNHDDMLVDAWLPGHGDAFGHWFRNCGGVATLASYGWTPGNDADPGDTFPKSTSSS